MDMESAQLKPIQILFVEDSPLDAEIVLRNFKKAKLANRVYHVKDGAAALEYLYHRGTYENEARFPTPGLILLDLNLPRVSGWEVLEALRTDEALCTIPVLVMTSSKQDEDAVLQHAPDTIGCITKPVDIVGIAKAIRKLNGFQLVLAREPVSGG